MRPRLVLLALPLLAGCQKSASYYQAHQSERASVLAACAKGVESGPDCQSAAAAEASQRHSDAETEFRKGIEQH